jgi:hypothetical protein
MSSNIPYARLVRPLWKVLLLLLDGLDEFEGEKTELSNFIKSLAGDRVKICVASRPDPPFVDASAGLLCVIMRERNVGAIQAYRFDVLTQ